MHFQKLLFCIFIQSQASKKIDDLITSIFLDAHYSCVYLFTCDDVSYLDVAYNMHLVIIDYMDS